MNILKFAPGAFEKDSKGKKLMIGCLIKLAWKSVCALLCSGAFAVVAPAQTVIEGFEYGSNAALLSAWTPQSATLTVSSYHSPKSTGTTSMRVDRFFPAVPGETEILTGPVLPMPIALGTTQYLSLRIAGSPQFASAIGNRFYIYAFDGVGNFGRWSATVPATTNWQVLSFFFKGIEKPPESPALPDLHNIAQFKFHLIGQGASATNAYSATIYLDDLTIISAPVLTVVQQGTNQQVLMNNLIPGVRYTLQQTTNLTSPVTVKYSFSANSASQTWPIPKGQQGFYKLYFAP